jgi:phosphate starvation-inducible PhoH-like protein
MTKLFNLLMLGIGIKYNYSFCPKYINKFKNRVLCMKKNNYQTFVPKTVNQEKYLKYLRDPNIKILISTGPAGTGKTFMACHEAITLLKYSFIDKIILTRPVVPVEEDIGFLPGTLVKKMDPWTRPILDVFEEKFSKQEIENLIKQNIIEISPLAYMRGRTFKNSFIIADEMQNSSPNQMLMLTTRIGDNSKMVITGDLKQTDKPLKCGLDDFITKFFRFRDRYIFKNEHLTFFNYTEPFIKDIGIQVIQLNHTDIQRSQVVKRVLEMYDEYDIAPVPKNTAFIPKDTELVLKNTTLVPINNSVIFNKYINNADLNFPIKYKIQKIEIYI